MQTRILATSLATAVGVCGIALVLSAWNLPPFKGSAQTTNDAYVNGQVTTISPQLSGLIVDIPVQDYQQVKKGDVLIKIDDRTYVQEVNKAKAALKTSQADLANFAHDLETAKAEVDAKKASLDSSKAALVQKKNAWGRIDTLVNKGFSTESDHDETLLALNQAKADVLSAKAALTVSEQNLAAMDNKRETLEAAVSEAKADLELAKINLERTSITAPLNGTLGKVAARVGQYVSAGTRLTTEVPSKVWVVANYKETQLPKMKVGQTVTFTVDALNGQKFSGKIERFAPATGSQFAAIQSDNATGNFTKVAQRVPVRIAIDPDQPGNDRLVPGLSVVTTVDVDQNGKG